MRLLLPAAEGPRPPSAPPPASRVFLAKPHDAAALSEAVARLLA